MDAIKQQLLRIQQQLSGLSASQKMLTASLVVIMVMTMFYWSRYAGSAEMVPLLDQTLSAEDVARMKTALSAKGINYQVTGDRILVPADSKFELIADLGYAQLLPQDFKDGFTDIYLKNDNPFAPKDKTDALANRAREVTLSQIIGRWPGVKNAAVMIDARQKLNPTRSIQPTAAVAIWMKDNQPGNRKLVEAAADLISGAQAGLARTNVKVSINGQSFPVRDPNDANGFAAGGGGGGGDENPILLARVKAEQYWSEKILSQLTYIQNVHATVSVDLKTSSVTETAKIVDPKQKVSAPIEEETVTEENRSASASGEPGMTPNTAISIEGSGSGGGGENSTSEKTRVKSSVEFGVVNRNTITHAGDATPVAAVVHVPESYFEAIWKKQNPGTTTGPTGAELEAIVQRLTPDIRAAVRMATNIKDETSISVASYIDITPPLGGSEAATAAGLASLPTGFGFGAKEIAIGVLAIISLFMVSMMVRKSVPQPVPVLAAEPAATGGPLGLIAGDDDLATEVGEGGIMMTGREMTEGELEAQQVIEQVGTMVKENPEVAATLVKRWLNRD